MEIIETHDYLSTCGANIQAILTLLQYFPAGDLRRVTKLRGWCKLLTILRKIGSLEFWEKPSRICSQQLIISFRQPVTKFETQPTPLEGNLATPSEKHCQKFIFLHTTSIGKCATKAFLLEKESIQNQMMMKVSYCVIFGWVKTL